MKNDMKIQPAKQDITATIETLITLRKQLRSMGCCEFVNVTRTGNQASMGQNIVDDIKKELARIDFECECIENYEAALITK